MDEDRRKDWLAETKHHGITCDCEHGLAAASGIMWQHLGLLAAGVIGDYGRDRYDPARAIIAEYLRRTGRLNEAAEVEAIGCNEPPPVTGFGSLSPTQFIELKNTLRS